MSVNYLLLRISPSVFPDDPNQILEELTDETVLPFGSQQEIIDCLCSVLGFEHYTDYTQTIIFYKYHHRDNCGRVVRYSLLDNPVTAISINRAYPEDLLPVIDVLKHLEPFIILTPHKLLNPEKLFYSFDDWIQKNYDEDELSFYYEG
jgi:hypothetical protein